MLDRTHFAPSRSLRVLQICEASSAGVGRHTTDLVRGLLRAGCDVHLLYSPIRVDDAFETAVANLPSGSCSELAMRRTPSFSDLAVLGRVRAYMDEHGPFDIVHGQSSKGGAVARLAAFGTRSASVYTPHCISTMAPTFSPMKRLLFGGVELALSLLTHRILAASQEEYDHILRLGVPKARVELIRHGVEPLGDVDRGEARARLGLPVDATIVGFVGRLSAQKDPQLAIRAFALIAKTRPHARLAIIGKGELEGECVDLARALGIDNQIDWLGYQDGYRSMPAFDVLVVPSRYEGLPYVMLEAISVGLPIVITPVGGVISVVDDGLNGFVVSSRTAEAVATALARLIDDVALRIKFSQVTLEKAKVFTIDTMVNNILRVYRDAVAQ